MKKQLHAEKTIGEIRKEKQYCMDAPYTYTITARVDKISPDVHYSKVYVSNGTGKMVVIFNYRRPRDWIGKWFRFDKFLFAKVGRWGYFALRQKKYSKYHEVPAP